MRFWDLSSPEVAAADAEPWDGPLAGATRRLSVRTLVRLFLAATVLSFQAAVVALGMTAWAGADVAHPRAAGYLGVGVLLAALVIPALMWVLSPGMVRTIAPAGAIVTIAIMGWASTGAVWSLGPGYGGSTLFYVEALPFAFFILRLKWALLMAANASLGCALVLFLQDGWKVPLAQWIVVVSTVLAVAWVVGIIGERSDRLAESERDARMELDEVNHTLEDRVAAQVTEIERLGELRRFLSLQVADAVLSSDPEAVLRPHRTRIAVFFCDLRGFTAFTRDAEPEEVVADIDQYYRAVGAVLQRHGATIGGYAGDGIMAYLGDPVPHPEPARGAVRMVAELRGELDALVAEWQRRGHDLSYGIGLAYGYATLGVVGFDGRYDYTPMGGVVNLAARLCGTAAAAQVLLDHATYAEVDGVATCAQVEGLELKGLGAQRAYALA